MPAIHIMARYTVKRLKVRAVRRAIVEFIEAVKRDEPGTQVYEAFQESDGVSFVHLMRFRNRRAQRIHETAPHVRKLVNVLYPACRKMPVFTTLKLVRSHHA